MSLEDPGLIHHAWEAVSQSWPGMLLGGGLLLVATGAGTALAGVPSFLPVRLVKWWVRHIARFVFRSRSLTVRTAVVLLNNFTVLTLLVAAGAWTWGAVVAIAIIGVNLGIGLRVLRHETAPLFDGLTQSINRNPAASRDRRLVRWGTTLNLLEPPAIMIALGLSLRRAATALDADIVWFTFAMWVVPLTFVAAFGEALWIGVVVRAAESAGAGAYSAKDDSGNTGDDP